MDQQAKTATQSLLNDILSEYRGRISIDSGSKILVSDANIATTVYKDAEGVRTPYGPTVTIATRSPGSEDASQVEGMATLEQFDKLKMDFYTHAVFGIQSEDPKYVLEGLKWMIYAMRPKGIAIVISLKQGTGQVEGQEDAFRVDLEDKIKFQSRGKASTLADVLEYAGFERGKIRSFDRETTVNGQKVEAQIVLAMKWDQLTA